jgi:F-type H+-transporting ATPase subunit b
MTTLPRVLSVPVVALLLSPAALLAAEEGGGGLFSLNVGLSLWTIVVFGVVLFILSRYAWAPILAAVDARERNIQSSVEEANRLRAEAQSLLEEHQRQLADSRRQSQQIVADAREAGEQVRREIEEKARVEGDAMLERARRDIQREKQAALDELRRESVDLALAAASRLVQQSLDPAEDRRLIESFLTDVMSEKVEAKA